MNEWQDAEAHANRALEMYERGRWAEAEAELRKALSLSPDQAEWHFNLGLTLEAAGRDADALASYERSIELTEDQPDPLLAAGVVANRLGRFEESISWLDKALNLDSTFEAAYAHKMDSLIQLGRHEEAETTFYLAQHSLEEESAQCLAVMAESLIRRSDYQRAEWCLREAMRLEPRLPRLQARLASVCASTGRPQKALQLYLSELREDPGSIDTLLEYGRLLFDLGRVPEAAEKFRRILELEPANVDAHYRLGQIALANQRYERAALEFELVLKLQPEFHGVHSDLGETLLGLGQLQAARQQVKTEYETWKAGTDQNEASQYKDDALRRLGRLLIDVTEPKLAVNVIESLIRLNDDAELWRQLALAKFASGDRDGGITASRHALQLDPKCIRSIHNLALAAIENGQLRIARSWIRRGLQIDRHDSGLRRLRSRLILTRLTRLSAQISVQAERLLRRLKRN